MTKEEQLVFVAGLTGNILTEVQTLIMDGKIPATWDGHELRQLLADKFTSAVFKGSMSGQRKAEYNNYVLVNDL